MRGIGGTHCCYGNPDCPICRKKEPSMKNRVEVSQDVIDALPALLPCPFCGEAAEEDCGAVSFSMVVYTIRCWSCMAHIERQDLDEVRAAWNKRT